MLLLGSVAPRISSDGTIEILGLEGESTNEKCTIQGKFIMVLTSAVKLGCLLQKKIFCNSIKQVSLVSSADRFLAVLIVLHA
jgi:hypothetical protein